MRVALMTCEFFSHLIDDDKPLVEGFEKRGADVDVVAWDAERRWEAYDLVVVRTPWDYQDRAAEFLQVLETISACGARLVNELELMRWNLDKRYLRELGERGVPVVETRWLDELRPGDLARLGEELEGHEFVIKPVVGASARDAYRLDRAIAAARDAELTPRFEGRPLMVQPFMTRIESEGEYSLMVFGGEPSHAVLKTPAGGDYRVQEEHGGSLRAVPLTEEFHESAGSVIEGLGAAPPYARIDLVRDDAGELRLMELELVEPELFFRTDSGALERFVSAVLV